MQRAHWPKRSKPRPTKTKNSSPTWTEPRQRIARKSATTWSGPGGTRRILLAWYEPNNPGPGDWRASDAKPSGPGVLPVFTFEKIEPGESANFQNLLPPFALILSRTGATDAEVKEVAGLNNLEFLSLGSTQVTDEGLKELAGLTNLRILYWWARW